MTWLLYLLNVTCASGQSSLGKYYAKCGGNASTFNQNKALAGTVVFLIWGLLQGFSLHWPTALLGAFYGVSLCVSMHTGFKALATGPMALTSIIASFSLLLPVCFGLCFWRDSLSFYGICGIVLILLSVLLINWKKADGMSFSWLMYALATLLTNGICSIIQKYHQIRFPSLYRTEFMVFALLCVLVILTFIRPKHSQAKTIQISWLGMLSGIMNGLSNYIVLYLSSTENASVLFPIVSVANIVAVWLIGIVIFKEKLRLLQTLGLALGIFAIVLLKL